MKKRNRIGERYGRLVVVSGAPSVRGNTGRSHAAWLCQCDCGNTVVVKADQLGRRTNSCGCIAKEVQSSTHKTHGKTGTRLFTIWMDMKARCNNPNERSYKDYGGRGIAICDEWLRSFELFMKWALENGYEDTLTIERVDVNGNYSPKNCKWIPANEQAINRRTSRFYTYQGETHCLTEWSKILGIDFWTLRKRLDCGWDVEKAFTTPIRKTKKAKNQAGIYIPDDFLTDVLVAHEMIAEG